MKEITKIKTEVNKKEIRKTIKQRQNYELLFWKTQNCKPLTTLKNRFGLLIEL